MKRSPLTIAIGAVLIVIFGLLLFMYQVRKSEVAVVTVFGKIDRVKTEPGPGLRWPWPIENVYKLDQRIQNFEGKFDEITLPDQNIILLTACIGWRIEDPKEFFPKFLNGSIFQAERTLEGLVRTATTEVAGQHAFPDFVSADERQMKYNQIESEILEKVERQVRDRHYGLDVKFVNIKQIGLPESVSQNVFDRMTAERQSRITRITSDGEEQATKIKAEADRNAAVLLADADARAFQLRSEGEAEMIKSLQVLQQNPALATFNMQIDALQQLLKEKSTLILDQTTPPLNLLQLPKPANSPAAK